MGLLRIVKKSMFSNFFRTGLLVFSLIIAVTTVVSLYLISSSMKRDFADKVDEFGTNIVIVPKSKNLSLSYAGVQVSGVEYENNNLHESDIDKLKTIKNRENLAIIAPKLLGVSDINGTQIMVAGVQFPKELKIKKWWEFNQGGKPVDNNDVILGGKAADKLKLNVSDSFKAEGRTFTVAGILKRVGTSEDDLVYIDLKEAQAVFNKSGQLSMIEVAAWCTSCPLEDIVAQASSKLPAAKVSGVMQAAKARDALINQFIAFSVVLSILVVAVSVLIVFTNMLGSVKTRRREIGIFRALGYRGSHILRIILLESLFVGIFGGISGYLLGVGVARYFAQGFAGIDLYIPGIDPATAYLSILGTIFISVLASLYPARQASKLNPTIALSSI